MLKINFVDFIPPYVLTCTAVSLDIIMIQLLTDMIYYPFYLQLYGIANSNDGSGIKKGRPKILDGPICLL